MNNKEKLALAAYIMNRLIDEMPWLYQIWKRQYEREK